MSEENTEDQEETTKTYRYKKKSKKIFIDKSKKLQVFPKPITKKRKVHSFESEKETPLSANRKSVENILTFYLQKKYKLDGYTEKSFVKILSSLKSQGVIKDFGYLFDFVEIISYLRNCAYPSSP